MAYHAVADSRGGIVGVEHDRQRQCALEALALVFSLGLVFGTVDRPTLDLVLEALREPRDLVALFALGRLVLLVLRIGALQVVQQVAGRGGAGARRRGHTGEVARHDEEPLLLDRRLALLARDVDIACHRRIAVDRGRRAAALDTDRHRDGDRALRIGGRNDLRAVAVDGFSLHREVAPHSQHRVRPDDGCDLRLDHAHADGDGGQLARPVVLGLGVHLHGVVGLGGDAHVLGGRDRRIADVHHRLGFDDGHGDSEALQAARLRKGAHGRLGADFEVVGHDDGRRGCRRADVDLRDRTDISDRYAEGSLVKELQNELLPLGRRRVEQGLDRAAAEVVVGDVGLVVDLGDDPHAAAIDRRRTDVDIDLQDVDVREARTGDLGVEFGGLDQDRAGCGPDEGAARVQHSATIDGDVLADDGDVAALADAGRRIERVSDDVHRASFERDVATAEDQVLRDVQDLVAAVSDVERRVRQPQHVVGVRDLGAAEVYPLQRRLADVSSRARDDDLRRPVADVDIHLGASHQAAHVHAVFDIARAHGRPQQGVEATTRAQYQRPLKRLGIDRVRAGAARQLGLFDGGERVGLTIDQQAGRAQHDVGVALLNERVGSTAAKDRVLAEATGDPVVTGAADEGVVACAAVQRGLRHRERRAGERAADTEHAGADQAQGLACGGAVARGDAQCAGPGAGVGDDDRSTGRIQRRAQPRAGEGEKFEHLPQGQCVAQVDIELGAVGQRDQHVAGAFGDRPACQGAAAAGAQQAEVGCRSAGTGCRDREVADAQARVGEHQGRAARVDRGSHGRCSRVDGIEHVLQRHRTCCAHGLCAGVAQRQREARQWHDFHASAVVQHGQRHRAFEPAHVHGDAVGGAEPEPTVQVWGLGVDVEAGERRHVDRVGACAASQFSYFEARDRIDPTAARQRQVRQCEARVARLEQGIHACAGVHHVGAAAAADAVVAFAAKQAVGTVGTDQQVIAGATAEQHRSGESRAIKTVGARGAVDRNALDVRQTVEQRGARLRGRCGHNAAANESERRGGDRGLDAAAQTAREGDDPRPAGGRLGHEHVALVQCLELHQRTLDVPGVRIPGQGFGGLPGIAEGESAARDSARERDGHDLVQPLGEIQRGAHGVAHQHGPRADLDRGVETKPAVQAVDTVVASQEVVACAALQNVVARAAFERDVAAEP